jgi:hypothetical protein
LILFFRAVVKRAHEPNGNLVRPPAFDLLVDSLFKPFELGLLLRFPVENQGKRKSWISAFNNSAGLLEIKETTNARGR